MRPIGNNLTLLGVGEDNKENDMHGIAELLFKSPRPPPLDAKNLVRRLRPWKTSIPLRLVIKDRVCKTLPPVSIKT